MKIVIPMAGEGSRFSTAGYSAPKPLIDVQGRPMIQRVIENLPFDATFIFIVRASHLRDYPLADTLKSAAGSECQILPVENKTEGAACTALLAERYIDTSESLMISNCDEVMDYSLENFEIMRTLDREAHFVWVFRDSNPKWSFVRVNAAQEIVEVAEKRPISDIATCGVYYWGQGNAFVSAAKKMIAGNKRVNNEFYIAPVYNEVIEKGKKVYPFFVDKMYGLGTPEDLEEYLKR